MYVKMKVAKTFAKPWVKGAVFGFIFGALLAGASASEIFYGTALESVPQFLGSVPAFILLKLMPDGLEPLIPVIYFIYWIALGALIGWGLSKKKAGKIGVAVFIVILFFIHFKAHITLQTEITGALEAFAEFLRTLGGGLGPVE